MDYPACFVSWCAMKPEVGSNLLYHACIILSQQDDEHSPLQVLDSVGFYGITPCSDSNPYIRSLKKQCGVDIDFSGGYGLLQHEEMRYLNKGEGLTGITFHLSPYRFSTLKQSIQNDIKHQQCAIEEATQALIEDNLHNEIEIDKATYELAAENKSIDEVAITDYITLKTKNSIMPYQIYAKEIIKAQKDNVEPRLKPFEFKASYSPFTFFTLSDSHTCKNGAVELLERAQIPLEWQIKLGLQHTSKSSIPRFSSDANIEELRLFSTGTYSTYQSKSTGFTQKTHNWQPELESNHPDKTKLFWSIPPDTIIADHTNSIKSATFLNTYKIDSKLRNKMDDFIFRLQKTHHLLLQSHTANQSEHFQVLLDKLAELNKVFIIPKHNKSPTYVTASLKQGNQLLTDIYNAANSIGPKRNIIEIINSDTKLGLSITLELSEKELYQLEKIQSRYETQKSYDNNGWCVIS